MIKGLLQTTFLLLLISGNSYAENNKYESKVESLILSNINHLAINDDWSCSVKILQDFGNISDVWVHDCKTKEGVDQDTIKSYITRAVYKSSPLPASFQLQDSEVVSLSVTNKSIYTTYAEALDEKMRLEIAREDLLNELKAGYLNQITNKIKSKWRYSLNKVGWGCDVYVLQDINGNVEYVNIQSCNVEDKKKLNPFKDSIERAVYKSSPLPSAPNSKVFDREILFHFRVD